MAVSNVLAAMQMLVSRLQLGKEQLLQGKERAEPSQPGKNPNGM